MATGPTLTLGSGMPVGNNQNTIAAGLCGR